MRLLAVGACLNMTEVATFCQVVPKKFYGATKAKHLELLQEYAEYQPVLGKDGKIKKIIIKEVYNPGPFEVASEFRARVERFIEDEWGKYDEPAHTADSVAVVCNRFCKQEGIEYQKPKYILTEAVYTKEGSAKKKRLWEQPHNPEMARWWHVYGIMVRYNRKDNKKSYRIYLGTNSDKTICQRLTEEQERQIEKLSKDFFGQKCMTVHEAHALIQTLEEMAQDKKDEEAINLDVIYAEHPYLEKLNNQDKWDRFVNACADAGLPETIKGCDRFPVFPAAPASST